MSVLARQRYLVDYAVASLRRRWAKSVGLWIIYATLTLLLGSVALFGSAIRREAAIVLQGAPDVVAQAMRMGRHDLASGADLAKLKAVRGVDRVEGRLWGYLYDTSTAANYTLQVPSALEARSALDKGEAMIGEGVARLRRLTPGKFLFLVSPAGRFLKLKVREILPAGSALVASDLVLVAQDDFRAFFELGPDEYTDLAMRVRNPAEVTTVAGKAALALPHYRLITRASMQRTYESLFSWREGLLLAFLASAMLAFVILAFDKASGLSAQERREIGVLKAVGWDTGDIIAMKLWEAALLSGTAFLAGVAAAYAHVFLLSAPLIEAVLKGWSTLYPRFALTPQIDGMQVATLAFLTIVPYVAAVLAPIWRTASADPDRVMR
jgi:ABC-type lipoprotein release transport system permease subunit